MLTPAWTATGTHIDPVSMRSQTRKAPAAVVAITVTNTWTNRAVFRLATASA
jgi:hypothetical protein